uniref:3-deoxy-7-phosphoheptulonate synthase n=1 Tax=Calcidiscus leptoporus TaxID=127549 RepID=A0A7S0IRU1_9EUKA|mmetsp:Transcript_19480/g.44774  ORF Transcript_19480/g.44774 Transcript_19480/m.44774 type:complete len:272 (+) Transcript_19480:1-816(+)
MDKPMATPSPAWGGLMNDPDRDGSYQINKGLRQARKLLMDINRLGMPAATDYLDPISPQFVADLVSWAAINSRTAESEAHRELASGLSTPVGFYNGSRADWQVAVDAVQGSAAPHAFLSVSKQGIAGIVETTGNSDCHVVLRDVANDELLVPEAGRVGVALDALQLPARVLIDCGSGCVERSPATQERLVQEVAAAVAAGNTRVLGVMLHSFLLAGKQRLESGSALTYGMSVTEPCMDWSATASALEGLAAAVRQRRGLSQDAPAPKRART